MKIHNVLARMALARLRAGQPEKAKHLWDEAKLAYMEGWR